MATDGAEEEEEEETRTQGDTGYDLPPLLLIRALAPAGRYGELHVMHLVEAGCTWRWRPDSLSRALLLGPLCPAPSSVTSSSSSPPPPPPPSAPLALKPPSASAAP